MPRKPAESRGHLYLVGLAGSGKSTVGHALAHALRRPFVDLDDEIVRREGKSIGEIFRVNGESYFRTREWELTKEIAGHPPSVVAPGGGWIMNPAIDELARATGQILYLKVTPETALARIGSSVGNRPLVDRPDALEQLGLQLATRGQTYEMADLVVDSETMSRQQVIEFILEALELAI